MIANVLIDGHLPMEGFSLVIFAANIQLDHAL